MSLPRRLALLRWASRARAWVLEDDYDSEFRFTERPLETLYALDRAGRVIYVGTFSKSLVPALRAGYLVAPPTLREALRGARQLADGYGNVPEQAALARFISDGILGRHLRRARHVYAERRELMLTGLVEVLGDVLEPAPSVAGLHVAARFRDPAVDDERIRAAALERGIAFDALSAYATGDCRPGLVLGYGAADTATITPGLRRLAGLLA
jgi:GntR family transcriptional regulator/MocR family aminotransferase